MTRTSIALLAAALFVSFSLGCGGSGPELGKVSGTVTIDGQPASDVQVSFSPVDGGRTSTGTTDSSGQYELVYSPEQMGAEIGKHDVSIRSDSAEPPPSVDPSAPLTDSGSIPPEYLKTEKQVDVTAGSNTIDLTYP